MADLPPSTESSHSRLTVADTQQVQRVTRPSHLNLGTLTVTLMSSDVGHVVDVAPDVEQQFRSHAEKWYIDTLLLSSYLDKILHPSYQKILTLGEAAIPLILAELHDMPNDWFWALRVLTEADPVTPNQAGDMQAMADAWIAWGQQEGYI